MLIGSKEYKKNEVLKHIGNLQQIGGARHIELCEGRAKGTRAIEVSLGSGLNYTIVADRGMDIYDATYKGINLVYKTQNGIVNPSYYNAIGMEWLQIFAAGLLTTCGLTYLGLPCKYEGEDLGLHGRYSAIPAEKVCDLSRWEENEYIVEITGVMNESCLFGSKLTLKRKIQSLIGSKKLLLTDSVINNANDVSPFAILYHFNLGFPLLQSESELYIYSDKIQAAGSTSEEEIKNYNVLLKPGIEKEEHDYLHRMVCDEEGYGYAAIINRRIFNGLGLYLKFNTNTLPYLNQWKLLNETDYVVGLEPCNVSCDNREILKGKNMLQYIEPKEEKKMVIEIGILEGEAEISQFLKKKEKILINNKNKYGT